VKSLTGKQTKQTPGKTEPRSATSRATPPGLPMSTGWQWPTVDRDILCPVLYTVRNPPLGGYMSDTIKMMFSSSTETQRFPFIGAIW